MNVYVCLLVDQVDSIWHHHITQTLRKIGHRVFIPPEIGLQESWHILEEGRWTKNNQWQLTGRILDDVKTRSRKSGVDLFFCSLFPFQFKPHLFKELTKLGIPSVYFFPDNLSDKCIAKEYAPYATINWVPESQAIKQFNASGSNAIYLPVAANPDINYPLNTDEIIDISFVGVKTPHRRDVLGKVFMAGLNLRIYGKNWSLSKTKDAYLEERKQLSKKYANLSLIKKLTKHALAKKTGILNLIKYGLKAKRRAKQYNKLGEQYETILQAVLCNDHLLDILNVYPATLLALNEINKVYSLSSVSIGFNDQFNYADGLYFHTNLRNFEATMAGACYLAEATLEINELFTDEKEIMIFHTVDELIDKAKFLLKNEAFRKQLRLAAHKRALSEHTWEHRFNKLFSVLGIK